MLEALEDGAAAIERLAAFRKRLSDDSLIDTPSGLTAADIDLVIGLARLGLNPTPGVMPL